MSNMVVGLMEAALSEREQTELVRQKLERNPRQMTMLLARQLNLPEEIVVRALPEGASVELALSRWEELMAALKELGEVHVIVSNGATTIESVGSFGGYSSSGGFFNVQSGSLDMHIRQNNLQSAYAVRKASHFDGHETLSIQFFDHDGVAAFKVFLTFGGKDPSAEREQQFLALIEEFGLRQRYQGGMDTRQAKKLKDLEKENLELKKLVADLSLDNAIIEEALRKY